MLRICCCCLAVNFSQAGCVLDGRGGDSAYAGHGRSSVIRMRNRHHSASSNRAAIPTTGREDSCSQIVTFVVLCVQDRIAFELPILSEGLDGGLDSPKKQRVNVLAFALVSEVSYQYGQVRQFVGLIVRGCERA